MDMLAEEVITQSGSSRDSPEKENQWNIYIELCVCMYVCSIKYVV